MKKEMISYLNDCIKRVSQIDVIISNRNVLCYLQEFPGSHLLTENEINSHLDLNSFCIGILKWLSSINMEGCSNIFGIDDLYEFRDKMCNLLELLKMTVEYYEMVKDSKIGNKKRRELEDITDRDTFMEVFRDMKSEILEISKEYLLNPPIKEVDGLNLYIEIGPTSYACSGLNSNISSLKEFKELKINKDLDSLVALIRTGAVDSLFEGCFSIKDYESFKEFADLDVQLRGIHAHYSSWKLFLNNKKYSKIVSTAERDSFILICGLIDFVDDEVMCEYKGLDIEVSKTKVRNYSGIFRGVCSDRRGDYKLIIDTNID